MLMLDTRAMHVSDASLMIVVLCMLHLIVALFHLLSPMCAGHQWCDSLTWHMFSCSCGACTTVMRRVLVARACECVARPALLPSADRLCIRVVCIHAGALLAVRIYM